MFKNLLLKTLAKLSAAEKDEVRAALDNGAKETAAPETGEVKVKETEKTEETGEQGKDNMIKDKVKTDKDGEETKETEEVETKDVEETNNEETPEEETVEEKPTVEEVEPTGNGVRVEDLVTKDELMERLAAFEAKFDAVVKENQDLKDKYENKDFGNTQKKGVELHADKTATETYAKYAEQFK